MKMICRPRRSGKTTDLVAWALKHDAVIVVIHAQEADRVCKQFGLNRERVLSWKEVATGKHTYGRHNAVLCVDNVELVLSHFLGSPVVAASVTEDADV